MNEILILSSSVDFTAKAIALLKNKQLDYPVVEATGQQALEVSKAYIEAGTKIIITRGNNLSLLRDQVNCVLIDVRYTFEDIHFTVQEALSKGKKIAYFGFGLAYVAAKKYQKISGQTFHVVEPTSAELIESTMKSLIKEGYDLFIGGITVMKAAKHLKVESIMIKTDRESLEIALTEGLSALQYEFERLKNYETTIQILNSTSEGIIGLNQDKEITYLNDQAKRLLKDRNGRMMTDDILTIDKINDCILNGKSFYNEVVELSHQSLVLSCRPIRIQNQILGSVLSIQNANYIESAEKILRKRLNPKGHIAKLTFDHIIGSSLVVQAAIKKAKKYASSNSTILITGNSGTGKEIFAQSIHNESHRRLEPFVAINCAALPMSVLESELFGYVKGAFTGARPEGKVGIFELAHNGTVFLDEVGEMSEEIQAKLLRVIQEKEISRLGDDKVIPIDVRIICATNKDLNRLIEQGKFREDLYYRLCVLELKLPDLSERQEDIRLLVVDYLQNNAPHMKISSNALEYICNQEFKGNIRQLKNVIERLVVMCESNVIDEHLVIDTLNIKTPPIKHFENLKEAVSEANHILVKPVHSEKLADVELQLILSVLQKNGGNKAKTAKELGLSYTTLWRRLKSLNE